MDVVKHLVARKHFYIASHVKRRFGYPELIRRACRYLKVFSSDLIKVYPDYEDRFELSWVNQTEDTLNEKKKKTKKVYPIIRDVVNQEVKIHFTSLNVPNKGIPFPNCRNLIFDEFLIKTGSSKRYLKDEVTLFFDIFQTIARLRKDFRCIMMSE